MIESQFSLPSEFISRGGVIESTPTVIVTRKLFLGGNAENSPCSLSGQIVQYWSNPSIYLLLDQLALITSGVRSWARRREMWHNSRELLSTLYLFNSVDLILRRVAKPKSICGIFRLLCRASLQDRVGIVTAGERGDC